MRAFGVVGLHPKVDVSLDLFERAIQLAPKRAGIELVLDGLVEPFANPVGLWTLDLRSGVLDALQIKVKRVLVRLAISAVLAAPIR